MKEVQEEQGGSHHHHHPPDGNQGKGSNVEAAVIKDENEVAAGDRLLEASTNFLEGWVVRNEIFGDALRRCRDDGMPQSGWGQGSVKNILLQFDEDGEFLPDVLARFDCCKTAFVCVLGDHKGLPDQHMRTLEDADTIKVSDLAPER